MIIKTFLQSAHNFKEHELLMKFHESIPQETEIEWELENTEPSILTPELEQQDVYTNCDVAVMFGSWKGRDKGHHITRNSIVEKSKKFLVFETPILNRTTDGKHKAYRLGINGFLNNYGKFIEKNQNYSNHRLESKWKINWNGWKKSANKNDHILILMQLPGDASLRGQNIFNWLYDVIGELRQYTNRPIRVRPHPLYNAKDADGFYEVMTRIFMQQIPNIFVSNAKEISLADDLSRAHSSVAFTSGSSIDSVLHGVPVIATDPGNFTFEISSHFVEEIEQIKKASTDEVLQWLSNLSHYQWTVDEISDGTAWKHIWPIVYQSIRHSKAQQLLRAERGKKK